MRTLVNILIVTLLSSTGHAQLWCSSLFTKETMNTGFAITSIQLIDAPSEFGVVKIPKYQFDALTAFIASNRDAQTMYINNVLYGKIDSLFLPRILSQAIRTKYQYAVKWNSLRLNQLSSLTKTKRADNDNKMKSSDKNLSLKIQKQLNQQFPKLPELNWLIRVREGEIAIDVDVLIHLFSRSLAADMFLKKHLGPDYHSLSDTQLTNLHYSLSEAPYIYLLPPNVLVNTVSHAQHLD